LEEEGELQEPHLDYSCPGERLNKTSCLPVGLESSPLNGESAIKKKLSLMAYRKRELTKPQRELFTEKTLQQ